MERLLPRSRIGDVIVVRDDHWGTGTPPYRALMTGSAIGVAAATSQPFPFFDGLGGQRVGSQVAIAVDPANRDVVYVAWGEGASGEDQTLRLRRSLDGGATWSGDLRVVPNSTNPALAVNSQGVAGFMYQRYFAATNRWETHFEYSSSGFTSGATDVLLADVPNTNPTGNHLGDYANMVAAGKHFYGAFSASNVANRANFPRGVTYLRNVNWTTGRLRNLAGTADVAPSIDPFFFRVRMLPPEKDFYVRDWNDGVTGDDGSEPSTHPVFFQTGDVWNRRGSDPGPAGPNDPPPNEDAGNGTGSIGDNWAFARIRRNAPSSTPATVTAHFLVSEFGTGSAYSDRTTGNPNLTFGPDVLVTFDPAETGPVTTPPMRWHLDPVMSPHLCLAVEISAPDDAFVPPSLAGQWPGWGTGTDLRILADNNRAQRNMGLTTVPAREMAVMDEHFGIVHNGATFPRDMELVYEVRGKLQAGFRVDGKPLDGQGTLVLRDMQPGENRSLAVALNAGALEPGEQVEIRFAERFAGVPVNGFTIAARGGTLEEVIREKLAFHRSVFTRLAALKVPGAAAEAGVVRNATLGPKEYVALLRKRLERIEKMLPDAGAFAVRPALEALAGALKSGDPARVAQAHSVLLHRTDAALTRARLDAGDPADVVLMVRWQRDLFRGAKLPCAAKLVAASERYVDAIGRRKITNAEYPSLLKESAGCLAEAGATKEQLAALFEATTLAAQQKAHREVLLSLRRD